MSRTKWILVACAVLAVIVAVGLVAWNGSHATFSRLKGVWYESTEGLKYDFASETQIVLPSAQSNGSNTVQYSILDNSRLSLTYDGGTQILEIKRLDGQELVTHNPTTGADKTYFRDFNKTALAQARAKMANGALAALKRFPTIDPRPEIVWTVAPPSGNVPPWPTWPTSTIERYKTAWDWNDVRRSQSDVKISGSGADAGYGVAFQRSVPTTDELAAYYARTGQVVDPGGPLIDVGYSASKAKYPAGTFIYVKGGMLYSLGDGYALGLRIGQTEDRAFAPYTYHP